MISGILVVDKPRGMTSHDVVARVRRKLGTREVGHAGTLDPMATGVLVVGVGEGTKLLHYLSADEKAYLATIALGVATDTLDADGTPSGAVPPSPALLDALEAGAGSPLLEGAVAIERARAAQVPPAYSAIHTGGTRAYELARKGVAVVLEARPVAVHELAIVEATRDPAALRVRVRAAKGYYVRAMGRDLAESLGTVGHLVALRRVRSGPFGEGDTIALDDVSGAALVPLADAARRTLPALVLCDDEVRDARHGKRLPGPTLLGAPRGVPHAWLDGAGRLVAIGETPDDAGGKVLRGFREAPPAI